MRGTTAKRRCVGGLNISRLPISGPFPPYDYLDTVEVALLSGGAFKVGHGYILGLPVAAYLTWEGKMLENNGIHPAVSVELSRERLREGRDMQLERAIEVVKGL